MPNEVRVDFIGNPSQLFSVADQAKAKLNDLAKIKISPQILNPGTGLQITKSLVEPVKRASSEVEAINKQTQLNAKSNATFLTSVTRDRVSAEISLEKSLEKSRTAIWKNEINNRVTAMKQAGPLASSRGTGAGLGAGVVGGLGVPIGAAAVGAIAGAGALAYGRESLDAAKSAANAQILLQSTARETGISYDKLTKQADAFGSAAQLSNAKAQSTFAQLVTFANAADRSEKIELFHTRFADLASAKGIEPSKLGDIAKQLNALTDEATDRLLGVNPSAFYGEFAKSIGKTADSLTDAEKRASIFDAIIRKGAIFEGTAAQRANSFAGEMDGLRKTLDDVSASAGKGIAPLAGFLATATSTALNGQSPQGAGPSPFFLGLANFLRDFSPSNLIPGASAEQFAGVDLAFEQFWKNQQKQAAEKFAASQKQTVANAGGSDLASRLFGSEEGLKNQAKIFEGAISRGNLGEIDAQAAVFARVKKFFDPEKAQSIGKDFATATARGFREAIDRADGSTDLQGLMKKISSSETLDPGARFDLLKTIKDDIDAGKEKVKELGRTFKETISSLVIRSASENPFVKLSIDGNAEIDKLRENTRGLSKDLRETLEQQQRQITAREIFRTQLGTGLDAIELRQRAAELRGPTPDADQLKSSQERFVKAFRYDNPNLSVTDPKITDENILKRFAPETLKDPDGLRRRRELSEQISFLNRSGLTGDQRFVADAQLVNLSGRSDARNLGSSDRTVLADALERQAKDRAALEMQSLRELQNLGMLTARMTASIEDLNRRATIGGKQGVEISIKNEAPNAKSRLTLATPQDTMDANDPDDMFGRGRSFNGVPGGYQ